MTTEGTERPPLELSPEQERRVWSLVRETLRPPPERAGSERAEEG